MGLKVAYQDDNHSGSGTNKKAVAGAVFTYEKAYATPAA